MSATTIHMDSSIECNTVAYNGLHAQASGDSQGMAGSVEGPASGVRALGHPRDQTGVSRRRSFRTSSTDLDGSRPKHRPLWPDKAQPHASVLVEV
jgi:hypothetical protein